MHFYIILIRLRRANNSLDAGKYITYAKSVYAYTSFWYVRQQNPAISHPASSNTDINTTQEVVKNWVLD